MKKIKFNSPFLTGKELNYIKDVFNENQFYGVGKYTKKCEKLISNQLGKKNILLTDSCTSSLEIAALLIKDKIKNEVIVPSYGFSSTANAFAKLNMKVVFAEIEKHSLMLDIDDVKKKMNKKTKAIVVIHYGGMAARINQLKNLCKEYKIILIEDTAQGYGCKFNNNNLGTIGDMGCFSFHETKNIHSGLGGAIYIKSKKDYTRAISIRERGTNRHKVIDGSVNKYSWTEMGGSFYPTEIQAAFLYSQLENNNANIQVRKKLYKIYCSRLSSLKNKEKIFFVDKNKKIISNYHAFILIFNSKKLCDDIKKYLGKNHIDAFTGYTPLHSSKIGKQLGNKSSDLPITEKIAKKILRLPLHTNLKEQDVEKICRLINLYFKK